MKVGDLVKMKRGYSSHGVILHIGKLPLGPTWSSWMPDDSDGLWAQILWSDAGKSNELMKDLEVIQYGNR